MARPKPSTRIGEAERAAAQRALHDHMNAGRLQVNEFAERSAAAAGAMTEAEITALFTDLPAPHPKLPGSPLGRAPRSLVLVGAVAVVALVGLLAFAIGRSGQGGAVPAAAAVAAPTPSALPATPTDLDVPSTEALAPSPDPVGTDTSDQSADDTATALPDSATVRRTTGSESITLSPNYGVDLDDDTSPNWSVGTCCDADAQFGSNASQLLLEYDHVVVTGAPTYATCSHQTAYTNGPIERGSLQPGENICVRTNGHRFALVTIISASDRAVQFRATVWDPPFSG